VPTTTAIAFEHVGGHHLLSVIDAEDVRHTSLKARYGPDLTPATMGAHLLHGGLTLLTLMH
jgi:hypothetical protein